MNANDLPVAPLQQADHCLRFTSLFDPGKAIVVPCDEQGRVDLDTLPARMRTAYRCARGLVGREYAYPVLNHLH